MPLLDGASFSGPRTPCPPSIVAVSSSVGSGAEGRCSGLLGDRHGAQAPHRGENGWPAQGGRGVCWEGPHHTFLSPEIQLGEWGHSTGESLAGPSQAPGLASSPLLPATADAGPAKIFICFITSNTEACFSLMFMSQTFS